MYSTLKRVVVKSEIIVILLYNRLYYLSVNRGNPLTSQQGKTGSLVWSVSYKPASLASKKDKFLSKSRRGFNRRFKTQTCAKPSLFSFPGVGSVLPR
jgi:hypothetical protein